MFLTIFTGTLVIQCLSHSAVKLSLVKFILSTNHGSVEKSLWWRQRIQTHCDINSDEYIEDTESYEDEDYDDKEDYGDEEQQPSLPVQQKQIMK